MSQDGPGKSTKSATAWFWIGNVANVGGVIGIVSSVLAGRPQLVVLFVAVVLVGVGYWVRRRGHKLGGFALVTVGAVGASATLAAVLVGLWSDHSGEAAAGAAPAAPSTAASPQDSPTPGAPESGSAEGTELRFDGEVTLRRHEAVDVDVAGRASVGGKSGATGDFDLFHDSGAVRSDNLRTHDGVYAFPAGTPSTSAHDVCLDYTGAQPSYNAFNPNAGLLAGTTFCFVTSDHHLAWATVVSVEPRTFTSVLDVKVWPDVVG